MSKFSVIFATGIFVLFFAILYHYFCRVRKKPEMIVQQRIQVPEGYVYPITPNINNTQVQHQLVLAPSYGQVHPPFVTTSNVPYPVHIGFTSGGAQPYNLSANSHPTTHMSHPPPRNQLQSSNPNQPDEDLPPPYHVAVANSSYPQ